jgi:hypothetical protein
VDAGIVGLPVGPPGQMDEKFATYAVSVPNVIMEIIADTGEVITKEGQRGQIVVTNFMRRLMPVIRYPMGDITEWVNYGERKFRFFGERSNRSPGWNGIVRPDESTHSGFKRSERGGAERFQVLVR